MLISVVVTAYNHEKYIAQCLESILTQKGDFELEVIVGDDCSTDQTFKVVEEFQSRYPKVFHVLPLKRNQGISKNLKRCLDACSGEYIAICEGDDYWTDERKLQKQKDFLDARQDCSMCFSALLLYYQEEELTMPHPAQAQLQKDTLIFEDLIGINYIGNFSCCMYRSNILRKLPRKIYNLGIRTDDWIFAMAFGQFGNIGFLSEIMSVYRIHREGAWSGKEMTEQLEFTCKHMDVTNKYFGYKYDAFFVERKKVFEDQLALLKAPVDAKKTDVHPSRSFVSDVFLRVKDRMETGLQLFKKKIVGLIYRILP